VGELRRVRDDVAHGVDVRVGRALMAVRDDETPFIYLDAGALRHQTFGTRTSTD
jgi:hypothetical protein